MNRNRRFEIRLTDDEVAFMEKKMQKTGIKTMSAYIRKMSMDGYIVNTDMSVIKELVRLMSNISSNVNQIARRANETGSIFTPDLEDLQEGYAQVIKEIYPLIQALAKS